MTSGAMLLHTKHVNHRSGGCRFTHDAIRVGDRAYICNTEDGAILELAFPAMTQLRRFPLFTKQEHINTLASYDGKTMWVVLHNLGQV